MPKKTDWKFVAQQQEAMLQRYRQENRELREDNRKLIQVTERLTKRLDKGE